MAELVDARDLKSLGGFHRAGSIPALGTIKTNYLHCIWPAEKSWPLFVLPFLPFPRIITWGRIAFAREGPLIIHTGILPLTFEDICISILVDTKMNGPIYDRRSKAGPYL